MLKKSILMFALCSGSLLADQKTIGWVETITTEAQCALASAGCYLVTNKTGDFVSDVLLRGIGESNLGQSLAKKIVIGLASTYLGGLLAQKIHTYIDRNPEHTHMVADRLGFATASFLNHYPKLVEAFETFHKNLEQLQRTPTKRNLYV